MRIAFRSSIGAAVAAVLVAAPLGHAAPGDLDPTFGTGGIVKIPNAAGSDSAADVVLRPNGSIVLVGQSNDGVQARVRIAQRTTTGAAGFPFSLVDTTFPGSAGDLARAGALQPDGKLVVTGLTTSEILVARYLTNGTLDPAFGTGGFVSAKPGVSDTGDDVLVQPNGRILVAGVSSPDDQAFEAVLLRYNEDGTPDVTFGDSGTLVTPIHPTDSEGWSAVALRPDGKIIAAGSRFTPTVPSVSLNAAVVARFGPDGALDGSFGVGGITDVPGPFAVAAVVVQPDGKILIGGQDTLTNTTFLARLDTGGTLDPTFGTAGIAAGFSGIVSAIALEPGGTVIVAGSTGIGFGTDTMVARYDASGVLDPAFGTGGVAVVVLSNGSDGASGVAIQPDGRIVTSGHHDNDPAPFGVDGDVAAVRFDGTPAACGNGVTEPGEACDDGNVSSADGCHLGCQIEAGFACAGMPSVCTANCGNGAIAGSETCDDAGNADGDGCSAACQVELGWTCTNAPSLCAPVCGDSRVVGAEQCDDGNTVSGDCCSSTCTSQAPGSPCTSDASNCSSDLCAAGGYCQHSFEPDAACIEPAEPGRAKLKILAVPGRAGRADFSIAKGPFVTPAQLGSPGTGSPSYSLCLYDHVGGAATPILDATMVGDGNCADGTCWQSLAWGLKYRSSTGAPDGITAAKLRPGLPGKSKLQVKAKGEHLATPALPLAIDPRVTAQIRTSDGQCFGATFSLVRDNSTVRFRAKSD